MLTLIRGIPGSGKSTLAKILRASNDNATWFEADMYMLNALGEYEFDFNKLKECHGKCLSHAITAMDLGYDVIVSNTFTRLWEMQNYLQHAVMNNHQYQIIHCRSSFKNTHNVPQDKIREMLNRFEHFEGSLIQLGKV